MPRALWWRQGGGLFLMSEVPLYVSSGAATLEPGDAVGDGGGDKRRPTNDGQRRDTFPGQLFFFFITLEP